MRETMRRADDINIRGDEKGWKIRVWIKNL